jgi:hypothetical protein
MNNATKTMTLAQYANKFEGKSNPPSLRFVGGLSSGYTVDSIASVWRERNHAGRRNGVVRVVRSTSTHVHAFDPSEKIEIVDALSYQKEIPEKK